MATACSNCKSPALSSLFPLIQPARTAELGLLRRWPGRRTEEPGIASNIMLSCEWFWRGHLSHCSGSVLELRFKHQQSQEQDLQEQWPVLLPSTSCALASAAPTLSVILLDTLQADSCSWSSTVTRPTEIKFLALLALHLAIIQAFAPSVQLFGPFAGGPVVCLQAANVYTANCLC